jgi:methionyl-tRNA synthetase
VGIAEVSEACDVDTAQIRQWLREERLEVTEGSPIYLTCEGCGASIRSGKYCDKCKASMANDFKGVMGTAAQPTKEPSAPDKSGPRMRFLQ